MRSLRVLVVEDFEVLAAAIGTGLRREGMAVDVVLDGQHPHGSHGARSQVSVQCQRLAPC